MFGLSIYDWCDEDHQVMFFDTKEDLLDFVKACHTERGMNDSQFEYFVTYTREELKKYF